MRLTDTVEILYLSLMYQWQESAPRDQHRGFLDGVPERNTQKARLAFLIKKIAAGAEERTFTTLARYTRRDDGESFISKDLSWMKEPCDLLNGWYLEGCASLIQKQEIVQQLRRVGLSGSLVAAADDFVANKPIEKYFPNEEEQAQISERIREQEREDEA